MKILLLSRSVGAVAPFLSSSAGTGTPRLGYVRDAQAAFADAPFVTAERNALDALGYELVPIDARTTEPADLDVLLAELDALYVASGSTFALLEALRSSRNDDVITGRVRAGLPYIGASAGSIIAGPDITPASLMDDPADGPSLQDFAGLGLIDRTVVPHADGLLPPYPPELIAKTLQTYGEAHRLLPLRDDQALLVDGADQKIIDSRA